MKHPKWEYKIVKQTEAMLESEMNGLGTCSWELVTYNIHSSEYYKHSYVFKRLAPDNDKQNTLAKPS